MTGTGIWYARQGGTEGGMAHKRVGKRGARGHAGRQYGGHMSPAHHKKFKGEGPTKQNKKVRSRAKVSNAKIISSMRK